MALPSKPNPRRYTLTMKVTKDTYLEVINEAERLDLPVSRVALDTFHRGREARK